MSKPRPCPSTCNVLLIGSGGREHALAWKMSKSKRLGTLWLSDSKNAGLLALGTPAPLPIDVKDTFRLQRWCDSEKINLVVIGPEAALAEGFADALATKDRMVFGPVKAAARLESDKSFAKDIMRQAAIPTAESRTFTSLESARQFVIAKDDACVVKASGLAAGKGAIVCENKDEALEALDRCMHAREFGAAGDKVVIEEKLNGQEVSVLALVDGRTISLLDPCQDHKQVGEGDTGPNTGGMGAYCPAPVIDSKTMALVERDVFVPAVDTLRREDEIIYRGVLYAGLMLTPGGPKVLEFNCRFGDPECQPLMMRLKNDLIDVLWATAAGTLDQIELEFDDRVAVCVVMCSAGYPGKYETSKPITGIDDAEALSGPGGEVVVFHAGTARGANGQIVTAGGRVLGVTALADDLQAARDLAQAACDKIYFEGAFWRHDIGDRVLAPATK
ncbi:MAG TPA: phosphoribosylamine--glycine ligase [Phycisphaerales bacterium]|nr:phosphoribosylamine--glycine ligase [Phycisphaerales bacterium]